MARVELTCSISPALRRLLSHGFMVRDAIIHIHTILYAVFNIIIGYLGNTLMLTNTTCDFNNAFVNTEININ